MSYTKTEDEIIGEAIDPEAFDYAHARYSRAPMKARRRNAIKKAAHFRRALRTAGYAIKREKCGRCGGSGQSQGMYPQESCQQCDGTGWLKP